MSYFSRVILDPVNYHANRLLQNIAQNSYREHQSLWNLFPDEPDARRDFIYRSERRNLGRVYYVVSQRKPEDLDVWEVESKLYQPKISDKELLLFNLRVNPVIKRKNKNGKSQRHDVVMDVKKQMKYSELPPSKRPSMAELIQKSGTKWLNERKESCGFDFDEQAVIVERYDQHQSYKKGNKGSIRYSTMDISGVLQVTDPDKFAKTLLQGIGPAKAFGCGLLLVRRV